MCGPFLKKITAHRNLSCLCPMYLTLHTKEAKKMLSSKEVPFSGLAIHWLSSATVNAAFFPALDDLYRRKFLFFV